MSFILRILYKSTDCIVYMLPKTMIISKMIAFHVKITFIKT